MAWWALAPPVADVAAHAYRAWLFEAEGVALVNAQWYGGHHVPGYSLLFPPLAALLGPHGAVAAAGLAAGAAGAFLLRAHPAASWCLAAAVAGNVVTGRGPFTLGIAFAALALSWRSLPWRAALLAGLTAAASPVAGLFLCLVGITLRSPALVAPAAALVAALALLFPEGGTERFVATAFWPVLAVTLAAAWRLPGRWREGALLYALALVLAFTLDTPMGQNAARFAVLAGPVALAVAGGRGRGVLIAALLYLAALPAVRAIDESRGDPATAAAFHAPLLAFLDRAAAPGDRLEIPLTRNHWEATHVAPRRALARGWERQLDLSVNSLFYDGRPLTAARYERWLRHEGIRWVALPDAPADFSARAERALLATAPAYLRPAFRSENWRVWELRGAPAPVAGPGRVVATGPQRIELYVTAPGQLRLLVRHSPFWRVAEGRGSIGRTRVGRLVVDARATGRLVLRASLLAG